MALKDPKRNPDFETWIAELFDMTQNSFLVRLSGKMKTAKGRLFAVLACYAVLIAIALYVLLPARSSHERLIVSAVLGVFAILIVKTLRHAHDDDSE
jgi:hypothetical protein